MLWAIGARQRGAAVMACPSLAVTHDRNTAQPHRSITSRTAVDTADGVEFFDCLMADIMGHALYKSVDELLTQGCANT